MIQLRLQTREDLDTLIHRRAGEQKLGERVSLLPTLEDLSVTSGKYVIFGICESIGVQANFGKSGTEKAWMTFLKSFINIQGANQDKDIILLGYMRVTPDEKISAETSKETLGDIVERIDKKVAELVQRIVKAKKIPIIIGGGHNNAFGNLKGSSQALKSPINAINIDAHTDLRSREYRHSGNGFSYAFENSEGNYLQNYIVFGLHQNYTPHYIFEFMKSHRERIQYFMMEDMLSIKKQESLFKDVLAMMNKDHWGIELDCDSIINFPSSAQTPSGFTLETVRQFMTQLGTLKNSIYLHICEAAPTKKNNTMVGKALTYLITDFIRSHRANNTL